MEESMRPALLLLVALPVLSGCANRQLSFSTLRQTSTLADIQETQVIENFARLAANPGALPFLSLANSGSATVTDGGSGSLSFLGAHRLFTESTFGVSASRSIALNWGLAPLNNPDRLKAMKAAYLSVLDPSLVDPAEQTKLNDVIKADPSYAINPGWMEVGGKWDVPKHAWRVGRCGKTYVWVMPDRAEDFSRFVLLTLNLASLQSTGKSPVAQGHVGPSAVAPPTPSAAAPAADPFPPRLYDQPPSVNPGLFFVPRGTAP
jgi:hypothetical protein